MTKISELINKIHNNNANWTDYSEILKLEKNDLYPFFNIAQKIKKDNFGNILKIYIPGRKFPSISITGNHCELNCDHCNKKYLNGMKSIINNQDLKKYLLDHYQNGGIGALISGGSLLDGSVPLFDFLDTLKEIKAETNLIFNIHTGLLKEKTAKKLAEAKVDVISFDINVDSEVIHNIYHLDKNINDYKNAINFLKKYKLNIVPHICFGLYYGKLHKELESLKFIKETIGAPSLIVLIALIPAKKNKSLFDIPDPYEIAKIITLTRIIFPKTEISLGCMRPRGRVRGKIERYAIKAGITRIEIPLRQTYNWILKKNPKIEVNFYSACCSIPREFEDKIGVDQLDLKRYLR